MSLSRERCTVPIYGLSVVTAPTVEPVDIQTACDYLKVETQDEVPIIQTLIEMARRDVEGRLDRTLVYTTLRLSLDEFPDGNDPIILPKPPVCTTGATSNFVITYDSSGVSTTLDSTSYTVDYYSEPGRIYPSYGNTWPVSREVPNAVTVTYVAGYGATATSVPAGIKTYMMRIIADSYENREIVSIGLNVMPHRFVEGLLDPYRWTVGIA